MYRNRVKRVIDIILSLCGLILASWLYLLIIIAIVIDDPGPVFFKQKRVGKEKTHLLADTDQYITRVRHFLRKTLLDAKAIIRPNHESSVKSRVFQVSSKHFLTDCSWNFNRKPPIFLMGGANSS